MKTATIRQVQHHLKDVLRWVHQGEEVVITNRRHAVARIVPSLSVRPHKVQWPDIEARLKAVFGKRRPLKRNRVLVEREESSW